MLRTVFLDAGGVLLFPNWTRVAAALADHGVPVSADALSTAFFVMGLEAARQYCQTHPTIGAVILPEGEGATPVTLHLPPGTFTPNAAVYPQTRG